MVKEMGNLKRALEEPNAPEADVLLKPNETVLLSGFQVPTKEKEIERFNEIAEGKRKLAPLGIADIRGGLWAANEKLKNLPKTATQKEKDDIDRMRAKLVINGLLKSDYANAVNTIEGIRKKLGTKKTKTMSEEEYMKSIGLPSEKEIEKFLMAIDEDQKNKT